MIPCGGGRQCWNRSCRNKAACKLRMKLIEISYCWLASIYYFCQLHSQRVDGYIYVLLCEICIVSTSTCLISARDPNNLCLVPVVHIISNTCVCCWIKKKKNTHTFGEATFLLSCTVKNHEQHFSTIGRPYENML